MTKRYVLCVGVLSLLLMMVSVAYAAEADRTIAMLMGDDVAPRREFIEENATYANIDA